jgi:hypothetical protein
MMTRTALPVSWLGLPGKHDRGGDDVLQERLDRIRRSSDSIRVRAQAFLGIGRDTVLRLVASARSIDHGELHGSDPIASRHVDGLITRARPDIAAITGEPLLFKGDDFGRTDLTPAIMAPLQGDARDDA